MIWNINEKNNLVFSFLLIVLFDRQKLLYDRKSIA